MPRKSAHDRPKSLPSTPLHYELGPHLVSNLTWAHGSAGMCGGMRFSYYGRKRQEAKAFRRRVQNLVNLGASPAVYSDEIERVLAGDLLRPERRGVEEHIRKIAVLCEAARQYGRRRDRTTAEICATYLDFLGQGRTLWAQFAGQPKERLLEIHRSSVEVPEQITRLYQWIEEDELVSEEPILRAATLNWGLSLLYYRAYQLPLREAIVDQELKAGGIDAHGLLILCYGAGDPCPLAQERLYMKPADQQGDLTGLFEYFAGELAGALNRHQKELMALQDTEDRLPWLMVRPPDKLDRQVFEIIERFGAARTREIHSALSDPPPLRTLQRRLKGLCQDGLVVKHGSRKDAYYKLAEQR